MDSKKSKEFEKLLHSQDVYDVYLKLSKKEQKLLARLYQLLVRLYPMLSPRSSGGSFLAVFFGFSCLLFSLLLYLYKYKNNQPEQIYQKITARLPEEYRSDLFQLRERWQKKGLSEKEINYLTFKHSIHIIFGLIRVKFENLSLFRYSSNKDN